MSGLASIAAASLDAHRTIGLCATCGTAMSWRDIRQGYECTSCRLGTRRTKATAATLLNAKEWAFEGVHERYSVALVTIRR